MSETLFEQLTTTSDTGVATGLRLDRIASVTLGIVASAFGSGIADVISAWINLFVTGPANAVSGFIRLVAAQFTVELRGFSSTVWEPVRSGLDALGPVAWIGAVVLVIATAWLAQQSWRLR